MNTFTDEDLTILESLEFEPACEKSNHDSDEPARWAAIFTPRLLCGCPSPGIALWCEPCRVRHQQARNIYHRCGDVRPAPGAVLRFEPLR